MISRTIKTVHANVLCMNLETAEAENHERTVYGEFADNRAVEKAVSKLEWPANVCPVKVVNIETNTARYSMCEADFVEHATKI